MRRDLCYYLEADIDTVYHAFLTAAQNEPFGRTCTEEHPYIFKFGLNFSMKYNMNGGALTLRFMPYQNGTAVNLRFAIAQGVGARYEKYALDLLSYATPIARAGFQRMEIPVELFVEYENSAGTMVFQQAAAPAPQPAPVEIPVVQSAPVVQSVAAPEAPVFSNENCATCGKPLATGAKFCAYCGNPVQRDRFCSGCGTKLLPDAMFCQNCGKKQAD